MGYRTVGQAVAEWDDNDPFRFTLSENVGSKHALGLVTYRFDLADFRIDYEDEFLLHLKDHLVERRNQIALTTIKTEFNNFSYLLRRVSAEQLFDKKVARIDETFLLALTSLKSTLHNPGLSTLRRNFNANPQSPIFAPDLQAKDFPRTIDPKGDFGRQVQRILAKALTRAACVEVLRRSEQAFEDGVIDIGRFSFINLAFSIYVRPDSYRRITVSDLVYDTKANTFFLYIYPAKSGVHLPQQLCYRINNRVGILLQKQRQHVINTFGNLVEAAEIDKIALFPASNLKHDKSSWASPHAQRTFGQLQTDSFNKAYFKPIQKIVSDCAISVNANALRHTVGTQLAQNGCSAKTIQAVLKHATDTVCKAYVDIAFQGLINELSDAMEPAFKEHLPVFLRFRAKDGAVSVDKAIYSEDIESGRTEFTGECGKDLRCQAAPLTCYDCHRFTPCYDADHSVNLDIVEREIREYSNAGAPYKHMLTKARSLKYRIILVMAACDRYQQSFPHSDIP